MGGLTIGLRSREHLVRRVLAVLSLAALLFPLLSAGTFAQEQRALRGVALVIGQSKYEHLAPLPNPANDADAIEALLSDLGFDSVRRADRDAATLARDLERFAEDAAEADVAVLYYSGHGIEAGGENFLIPVDADLSALDNAGEKLVPVSALIEKLKATVPVAIVMLDACRDNPFPPGSLLRRAPDAEPTPLSVAGLGLSRGAASLKPVEPQSAPSDKNVGTVIAFAAEPGKVALDGDAGGNSPYAAAILRHLDAMAGEEFGMVMRMVAEEVYLKTGGQQRPWVNESLRRLLYFGEKPVEMAGDEGDILKERRQLLVTIAALPDLDREQVESVATDSGVPMDAVYGMLRVLGGDVPKDPGELDALLRSKSEDLKRFIEERKAATEPDETIVRLNTLADQAELEGALDTADALREKAKTRVRELRPLRKLEEEALRQRMLEDAEVFARSAETKRLRDDMEAAASDYGEAFRIVERWDDRMAGYYKLLQGISLAPYLNLAEEEEAQKQSLVELDHALALGRRSANRHLIGLVQNWRGQLLFILAGRDNDNSKYRASISAFQEAIANQPNGEKSDETAALLSELGKTMHWLGAGLADERLLAEASISIATARRTYAATGNREMELETAKFSSFMESFIEYDFRQFRLGEMPDSSQPEGKEEAKARVETYVRESTLSAWSQNRNSNPDRWALAQHRLGKSLRWLGQITQNSKFLEEAAYVLRNAMEVRRADKDAKAWAFTQAEYAQTLFSLGETTKSLYMMEDAREKLLVARNAFRSARDWRFEAYLSELAESYSYIMFFNAMGQDSRHLSRNL